MQIYSEALDKVEELSQSDDTTTEDAKWMQAGLWRLTARAHRFGKDFEAAKRAVKRKTTYS